MNLEKYRALFVDEASDHLAEMSRAATELEKPGTPADRAEAIETLFRMAHSIKGMAASLDFSGPEALAHRLEDWMEPLRSGSDVGEAGVSLLYDSIAALEGMVRAVHERRSPLDADPVLLARMSALEPGAASEPEPAERAEPVPPPLAPTVRVRAEAMDGFLAGVGELIQHQARLESMISELPYFEGRRELGDELERMETVASDLRRRALGIRTTPVRRLFERIPRLASELARRLGKRVEVVLEGDEVEADRAVLDHLDDALLHLVRNAIDHGVESPEERERSGKPATARLRLAAAKVGTRIWLLIGDDGHGIDAERIRSKAVERGLLADAVAEDLPVSSVYDLVFEPGMSTRELVTEVSGRGVGLDAVRRSVQALGGTIRVSSSPGAGTTFELELPSSVAVQRLLVLQLEGRCTTLPANRVQRVVALEDGLVEGIGGDAFFVWNDEPLPLVDLAPRLGLDPTPGEQGSGTALVLEVDGFRLALRVERVIAEVEVFVRDLPSALVGHPFLAGVAVLPDGAPVFLLEPGGLLEEAL